MAYEKEMVWMMPAGQVSATDVRVWIVRLSEDHCYKRCLAVVSIHPPPSMIQSSKHFAAFLSYM